MPEYGDTFGMTFRFRAQDGDAPELGLLGRKDRRRDNGWRQKGELLAPARVSD
jgi:hypothetical protein